jgi:hypothetical protein
MGCKQTLEIAKVFANNSDNNMVAKKNCGLKGGGVRIARPEMATPSAVFNGILIIQFGRNAKINNLGKEILSWH